MGAVCRWSRGGEAANPTPLSETLLFEATDSMSLSRFVF